MVLYKERLPELVEPKENYFKSIIHPGIPVPYAVEKRLEAGARVAEFGCSDGESVILMAQAYPKSFFTGIGRGYKTIMAARRRAKEAKVTNQVSFFVGSEKSYFGEQYDIVITHHDSHKPEILGEIAVSVREKLLENGVWLIAGPLVGEDEQYLGELAAQQGFLPGLVHRKRKAG